MKETRVMKIFEQYMKKFDINKGNVKAMYFHSIKMMELCKDIASNIGVFSDEEIIVCGMIGLFHEIGNFSNKFKNCLMLEDNTDSSKKSLDILFGEDGLMRKITDDTKYDDLIKVSIYCLNKSGVPKQFDKKTILVCMILKDADVIENFRMVANYPYMDMYIDYYPNDIVYNTFKQFKVINSKVSDNDADKILEILSLVFGVYFNYSYSLIKNEDSINKLIGALKISNKGINKFFLQIGAVLNAYVERKIG